MPVSPCRKPGLAGLAGRGLGVAPDALEPLTWGRFFIANLLPVTIGNIIGGCVFVGGIYWIIYARKRPASTAA